MRTHGTRRRLGPPGRLGVINALLNSAPLSDALLHVFDIRIIKKRGLDRVR